MSAATAVDALSSADVQELVGMVWESVLERTVEPAEPVEAGPGWLTGTIRLIGEWPGRISVSVPEELAEIAAAMLFGLAPGAADEADRRDAIGELTNMTGGNVKALVDGTNQLGLPIVDTTSWTVHDRVFRDWWFATDGLPFVVRVTQPRSN